MDFFDFMPIEYRGMSILTLLTFVFYTVGFGVYYGMIMREFKRINDKLAKHEDKIDGSYEGMNTMKTDVALLLQSVTRIEDLLKEKDRDRRRD